jgi:hypothetical protein
MLEFDHFEYDRHAIFSLSHIISALPAAQDA